VFFEVGKGIFLYFEGMRYDVSKHVRIFNFSTMKGKLFLALISTFLIMGLGGCFWLQEPDIGEGAEDTESDETTIEGDESTDNLEKDASEWNFSENLEEKEGVIGVSGGEEKLDVENMEAMEVESGLPKVRVGEDGEVIDGVARGEAAVDGGNPASASSLSRDLGDASSLGDLFKDAVEAVKPIEAIPSVPDTVEGEEVVPEPETDLTITPVVPEEEIPEETIEEEVVEEEDVVEEETEEEVVEEEEDKIIHGGGAPRYDEGPFEDVFLLDLQDQMVQIIASNDIEKCQELELLQYAANCEIYILADRSQFSYDTSVCVDASTPELQQQCVNYINSLVN